MDIGDGIPFVNHMKIYAGDYSDVENAGIVIITAEQIKSRMKPVWI